MSTEGSHEPTRSASFQFAFWPFVLATTSVGQEGLDFHTYCHAVMHWNLPAIPSIWSSGKGGSIATKDMRCGATLPGARRGTGEQVRPGSVVAAL